MLNLQIVIKHAWDKLIELQWLVCELVFVLLDFIIKA